MSIANNNLFSQDGFFWWFGVVEDRHDPLLLGRVRVRIIGYHTDDQSLLSTDDLPWAIPMQSINSAAISGKGDAPLGPLEGTWVIGFFADGKDCQQPVVMGTLGGLPGDLVRCGKQTPNLKNVKRDQNGNIVRDQNGNPIPEEPTETLPEQTPSNAIRSDLPPLTQQQIQNLMDALGQRESGSIPGGNQNYTVTNQIGFVGKYQFGAAALQTLGYVNWPVPAKARRNSELNNSTVWNGKNGISSVDDWKANKNNVQEVAMFELVRHNYNELKRLGVVTTEDRPEVISGYLATAHLLGPGGARDLERGIINKDGNGTSAYEYFNLGVRAQGATVDTPVAANNGTDTPTPPNPVDYTGPLNDPKLGNPDGFGDPNQVYPNCDYVDRQDTNKLATNNDDKQGTILEAKEKDRVEEVPVANGGESWEEPPSAYNAKYPYNKVKETESGHVIEMDDTPNAERIHIYHKSGTHIEIDKNGTVRSKFKGDSYQIINKNNNLYVQGSMNISIDGAKTLLVKNTVDVEIHGKTTINIKNDADVNISGNLNVKAKNISMQADQDINLTAGNYMNVKTGGDLNYIVAGDEQHLVSGTYDLDAILVNINSGTTNPFTALGTGLDSLTSIIEGELTNLPLPADLANALNPMSKSLSGLIGQIGGVNSILNVGSLSNLLTGTGVQGILNNALANPAIANAIGGLSQIGNVQGILSGQLGGLGGIGNVINTIGLGNFNQILGNAGLGNLNSIVENALSNPALANAVAGFKQAANVLTGGNGLDINKILETGGLPQLDRLLSDSGLGNLNNLLTNAGVNLQSLSQNILSPEANQLLRNITDSGVIPQEFIQRGADLTKAFYANGAGNFDVALAKIIPSVAVSGEEFQSWGFFSPKTQLSKYFDLGKLTTLVAEPAMQFPIMKQFGLTKADITTNLKALSVNVLDPITDRYRNLQVTDAFRPSNGYLSAIQVNNPVKDLVDAALGGDDASAEVLRLMNSPTAHNLGQAANIQFKDMAASEYYDAARWIRDNVAYDQIRLEYSTMGDGQPHITVTHNPAGNRPADAIDKVVTCVNGQVVANYLVDMTRWYNMFLSIFPTALPQVYEYQQFLSTHTFNTAVTVLGYTIATSANPCGEDFAEHISVTFGPNSVTVSGYYQNIFIDNEYTNRDIKLNDTLTVYNDLEDMPDQYWSAVKVRADRRDIILVTITINTTLGSVTLTQNVRNDLSRMRNKVIDWVYDATVCEPDTKPTYQLPLSAPVLSDLNVSYVTSITFTTPALGTNASGTFIVPAGVSAISVTALGGGGGGGSGNENNGEHGGGGGGSGGYQVTNLSVTTGQVLYWQVGGAGTGMSGGTSGSAADGGNTFFGTVISTGGKGGTAETGDGINNSSFFGKGGAGGTPNGIAGDNGTYGNGNAFGGNGANSPAGAGITAPQGTGGPRGINSNGAAGDGGNATGFGAGGGGAGARDETGTPAPNPGGNGAPGWLQISYGAI